MPVIGAAPAARSTYPMETDVSVDAPADMFTSAIEGCILLSRAFGDNQLLVDQLLTYRAFVRQVFRAN